MSAKTSADQPSADRLERAIDKAKEVAAEIAQAADNLAVANTVLQNQIPEEAQVGEVAQALEQSDQVEKLVTQSAQTLDKVHNEIEKAAVPARRC